MGTSADFGGSPKWGTEKGQITSATSGALSSEKIQHMLSAFVGTLPPSDFPSPIPDAPGVPSAPDLPSGQNPDIPNPQQPDQQPPVVQFRPAPGSGPTRTGGGGGGGGGGGAGGGGRAAGGGKSSTGSKGGRGGRSAGHAARNLGHFISSVATVGFPKAAQELGISLEGKTPIEISEALTEALCGPQSTIDEVAVHNAMSEVMAEFFEKAHDAKQFESSIAQAAPALNSMLAKFFGNYIFQRFCTLSYASMLAKIGAQKAEAALGQIKSFIDSKVSSVATERNLTSINWKGTEGQALVDKIRSQTEEVFSV